MDKQILDWITPFIEKRGPFKYVLELGSLDVNGTIKPAFVGTEHYTGLDMREGPGVDIVCHAAELQHRHGLGKFDCIVATSFFEHDATFWETLAGVHKLLSVGGWFVLTVPTPEWGYHAEPKDYYRFTTDALRDVFFHRFDEVEIFNPLWPTPTDFPHCVCQHMGGCGRLKPFWPYP